MVIIDQPQKNHRDTVVPRSYATPSYAIFKGPKKLKLSYFPPSYTIFPPIYAIFLSSPPVTLSFSPQLTQFSCYNAIFQNVVTILIH